MSTKTGETNLCGGQHGVFVQAEDSVSHDGFIGQKAAAHHLWEEVTSVRFPVSNVSPFMMYTSNAHKQHNTRD